MFNFLHKKPNVLTRFFLGNSRCLHCPRDRATILDRLAPMDAAHVSDFYSCDPAPRCRCSHLKQGAKPAVGFEPTTC